MVEDRVRAALRDDAMTGIDAEDGWLYVSKTDNGDAFTHFLGLLGEFGCEVEGWPTERVRAVLRSERYFHAIHYLRALAIHPLNYALGLAAAAERDGARIFENTPALSIDPPACASASSRRTRGCAPITSCCAAMCGSAR